MAPTSLLLFQALEEEFRFQVKEKSSERRMIQKLGIHLSRFYL